LARNKNNVS